MKINGQEVTLDGQGKYVLDTVEGDVTVTVEGVVDGDAPVVTVTVGTQTVTQSQTANKKYYFKTATTVTISATDAVSGVAQLEYLLSAAPITDLKGSSGWTPYTTAITLPLDTNVFVYVRCMDGQGNLNLFTVGRVIVENVPPVIEGFANGDTVYGDLVFTVSGNPTVVRIDGLTAVKTGNSYTIEADNQLHTVTAFDAAGNKAELVVTVYRVYTVTFVADGQEVTQMTVNHGQNITQLPTIPTKTGYTKTPPVWDTTDFTTLTGNVTVNAVYTADPVETPPASTPENTTPDSTPDSTPESTPPTTEGQASAQGGNQAGKNDNDSSKDSGGSSAVIIIAIVGGCALAGGGAGTVVLLKKKKK